jgi:hypothetical protein
VTVAVSGSAPENIRYHQIRRNDREGDGKLIQMTSGVGTVPQYPVFYDALANVYGSQPRGNTAVVQLADQTAGFTVGNVLVFDANGNATDGGKSVTSLGTRQGFIAYYLAGKPSGGAACYVDIPGNLTSFTIPANFAGAYGKAGANPTATATYSFARNGGAIGTLTISTSGTFTWATGGGGLITFTPGTDELSWTAPNTQDATLSDVRFGIPVVVS